MKIVNHSINRMALTAVSILCLGASAFAGPAPMFMKIHGRMYQLVPMDKDMTTKNGCKVCMDGSVTTPHGSVTILNDGDYVTTTGVRMPAANHAHGG